jgi:hypothetical protein
MGVCTWGMMDAPDDLGLDLDLVVVHDLPFLKLCCDVDKTLFAFMKASRSYLATVSSSLDKAQSMATGLYDAGSFLAFPPPLYTGWISAVLKADENTPADKDMLTRWLTGPANMSDPILRTDTGILSVPRAEVVSSVFEAYISLC